LCRRQRLAGNAALRHGSLLDGEQRLAATPLDEKKGGPLVGGGAGGCGAGRASTGNSGSPLRRSRKNRWPILVGWMSAGTAAPFTAKSRNTGCDGAAGLPRA